MSAFADDKFELALKDFSQRLEQVTSEATIRSGGSSCDKLRPNYDGEWLDKLKTKLQAFDEHRSRMSQ